MSKHLTKHEMEEIAKEAIDRHLGDVVDDLEPDASEEEREAQLVRVQEEAYVLAHDALTSVGVPNDQASSLAKAVSKEYGV